MSNKGAPRAAADIEWVALIGQSVSIASAQSGSVGSDNSLETAWRAEAETLKSILTGAPQSKLGRIALVDTIAKQIRKRMKVRLPNLLTGYACYADHPVLFTFKGIITLCGPRTTKRKSRKKLIGSGHSSQLLTMVAKPLI